MDDVGVTSRASPRFLTSPFDLGDRIIILPPEATDNPGSTYSWFVEGKLADWLSWGRSFC